jgi:hypothetical protein
MAYRQLSGTNDENTMTDLATALAVILQAPFLAIMSNQISMTGITCFQVTGANETPGRTVFEQPNPGIQAAQALPGGAAGVLSITTDAPNSKFNGRMFVSGGPEDGQVEGDWTVGHMIGLNALGTALQVVPPAIGPGLAVFQPSVISRFLNGVPRVPPVGFDVISIAADDFVKNQRRRNTKFIGAGGTT